MTLKLNLEEIKQSQYSPSIVENSEQLIRLLFAPEHILDGQLTKLAISTEDLMYRGFSVNRLKYLQPQNLKTLEKTQKEKNPTNRETSYISEFNTEDVRVLFFDNNERAFVVLDDGIEENFAHAIILDAYSRSKPMVRKLKSILLPILQSNLKPKN